VGGDFSGSADKYFLEFFGEFAGDADLGVWGKDFDESCECSGKAMRRFEVDRSMFAFGCCGNFVQAAAGFLRHKASKVKRKSRETAGNQGMNGCGWARNDFEGEMFPLDGTDDAFPRIGNSGHAGIGNKGDRLATADPVQNFRLARSLVELLVAEKGFFQLQVLEKKASVPGVLCGDQVGGS